MARPVLSLRGRALKLLAGREHSRVELARKLSRHIDEGESPDRLEALLDEFERAGWLSNERFAERLVERRGERFGRERLRRELAAHGIDGDAAAAQLDALEGTEHERALEVWRRKFGGEVAEAPEERARQARFLAQRGFAADTVARIVRGRASR